MAWSCEIRKGGLPSAVSVRDAQPPYMEDGSLASDWTEILPDGTVILYSTDKDKLERAIMTASEHLKQVLKPLAKARRKTA